MYKKIAIYAKKNIKYKILLATLFLYILECKKPIIAIGGINEKNVYDVIKAGADGVAIVSAICGAKNIKVQAKKIKEIILKNSL